MDIVIMYIIVSVLMSMITSSLFFIFFAILTILIFIFAAVDFCFFYMTAKLLLSKAAAGRFVRVAEVKNSSFRAMQDIKYKVAVYRVDEKEYESIFPAEGLFGLYFYKKDRLCRLWLNSEEEKVFDGYNVASCIIWPIFCTSFCIGLIVVLGFVLRQGLNI